MCPMVGKLGTEFHPYVGEEHDPVAQVEGIPSISARYAEVGYLPEISFRVANDIVDHGTPVYGELILFPRRKIRTNKVKVRIVALQAARLGWVTSLNPLGSRRPLLTKRYKDLVLKVSNDDILPKGTRFTIPFCIEFPTYSDHQHCSCVEEDPKRPHKDVPFHEFLPPSHGIQMSLNARSTTVIGTTVSYHIEAIVEGTDLIADCPLNFRPASYLLNVNRFDANIFRQTSVSSVGSASGSLLFSNSLNSFKRAASKLEFSADMLYHDISNREGLIKVVCRDKDPDPTRPQEHIERITYYVHKNCYACPTGLIKDPATSVTSYAISGGKCVVDTPLEPGKTSIAVTFSMTRNKNLKLVPSYISCLTAVLYQLELIFKCTSQRYRLIIPLICAASLDSFKYSDQVESQSVADLHFMPQECPSLIEDESCVWDLSSTDDTIFTME